MTVEEYLGRIKVIDVEIWEIISELEDLRELQERLPTGCGAGGSGSMGNASFTKLTEKIVEYENRLAEKKEELFRERMQKRDEIEAIQDWRYRIILKERYLHFESYEKIAEIIGISERHFHRIKLKDKAHEAFAKIYKHVIESQL